MKVALIGLGVIGNVHLNIINNLDVELVGVCDVEPSKLESIKIELRYSDYRQMLDEVNPDIVHICTPHHLHSEMIIYALEKNINVLCEKPLCINENEIINIEKVLKRSKGKLGICYQNRYNPSIIYLDEYLKDKKINSVIGNLLWHRDKEYYSKDYWHGVKKYEGGGVLINQAIHTIDLLQHFIGVPNSIVANVSNVSLKGVIDVEDTGTIYSLDHSFYLMATNSASKDYPVSIIIKTENEDIKVLENDLYVNNQKIQLEELQKIPNAKKIYGRGHTSLIKDFYDCIKNNKNFEIDFYEAIKSLKIVLAAYSSEGKEVKL